MDGSQLTLDFDAEEWRVVPDWPDYEVSSHGRVRRATPSYSRNKNGTIREQRHVGQLLKGAIKKKTGYHSVVLHGPSDRKADVNVHTLVCRAFHGAPPTPKHEVAHEDGCRTNNYYKNLSWKTHKENGGDMIRHGRTLRGTKHHFNRLTEADVLDIRARADAGQSHVSLAREYKIAKASARRVAIRKSWAWLPEQD